jgi:hypothetical protein
MTELCHCEKEAVLEIEGKYLCATCYQLGCNIPNAFDNTTRCLKKPFYDPSKDTRTP